MTRKRLTAQGESGRQEEAPRPFPFFPLCAFLTIALGYLIAFFSADEARRAALFFIAAPDRLFVMWCGGNVEYFSLLDRWPVAILAAVILGGAWLSGRLGLKLLGVTDSLDRLERNVFAMGVGLSLMSLYALAVGLAGGLRQRWAFIVPLGVLVLANAWDWHRNGLARPSAWQGERGRLDDDRWYWWLLAAVPFALMIVLGGMLPPSAYDVREYHLQAPKEWFQNGRIEFLPHNIYANMPLGSELTSLWAMALVGGKDGWWWGAIAGKTAMACYSLVTAAALLGFGRRVHSLAAGVIAAVVFLSTPWIVSLAIIGYNEGPVAMFALLAIYALFLGEGEAPAELRQDRAATAQQELRPPSQTASKRRLIELAGFCAGSAVACKYPPMLFLVIPLAAWVGGGRLLAQFAWNQSVDGQADRSARAALIPLIVFLAATFAGCGLWFAKNAALTRNPTYPLLYSLFDGRTRTPEKDRQWTRVHSPQPDSQGHRFSLRELIGQIAWIGWRTRWASMAILPLALMACLSPRPRGLMAALAGWMIFVFAAWWLLTHRLDRFLILLLPAASLTAGIGAVALQHTAWRIATLSLVACSLAAQFALVALPFSGDNRFFAPLEGLRRDDLALGDLAGYRIDFAHRWLNGNVPAGYCVLLVGDAEPFDLEVPAIYNTCFDDCQFTRLFKGRTREERLAALREARISHLFVSWTHLARYRSPGNYGYASDFPTPELVHNELVKEQGLLRRVPMESMAPEVGEIFEVVSD